MTTPTRFERTLPTILDELAAGPTPDYLDDVFARTTPMRQRPGWTFPERWLPMADITRMRAFAPSPPWRLLAIALVVLALVATALVFVGTQRRLPSPFGPAGNGLIPYDKGGDIYVGNPVTGESRLVLGGPENDTDPGYSPDGTRIAFLRSTDEDHTSIFTVQPDGGGVRQVTAQPLTNLRWATWAPDSRHLAVIDEVAGSNRLQSIDVTGQEASLRLAPDMQPDSIVYRPPDAKEILFRAFVDGAPGLYVMNADGTNIRTVIEPSDLGDLHLGSAEYSPDGSRIYYTRAYTAEEAAATSWPEDRCCKLWVMNADGSGARQFVNGSARSWDGIGHPSPDGRWVAFWHVIDQGRVAVVASDGSGPIIDISPTLTGLAAFVWSPDSKTVLMVPTDDVDKPGAYLLDPAGGSWVKAAWQTRAEPDWQRLALE